MYGGVLAGAALANSSLLPSATAVPGPDVLGDSPDLQWPAFDQETRPWTRWWWHGSAVTEKGLRRELDDLARSGFGGVEVQPIYEAQGYEDRVLPYLSQEWLDALDTTIRHADIRGLGVDLTTGSGWTFGGPWISPNQSAGRVLVERWELQAGERLDAEVKTVHPPHPDLVDEERLSRPDLRPPMEPIPEPPLAALVAREVGTGHTVDLTGRVGADRKLDWTAPPGTWQLTGVFSGWVLKRVERAGPGGKGLMADYFDADAIDRHLAHFGDALGRSRRGIRALFHDSFELERMNWTHRIVDEFTRLRGYPLTPHLAEVFDAQNTSDTRARVLSDIRESFSDLFLEKFARRWAGWSVDRGWLTRNQAHGSPANLLDVYAAADIPETEFTGGKIIPVPGLRAGAEPRHPPKSLVWRMAASAAHLYDRKLVGAETMTWRDEHYHVSLSQGKPEVDVLFSAGINHVVFHGTTYSPEDAPWPGLSFYASTQFRRANTWWRDLPELNAYITRCQSILQNGKHGNDVLVYWPQHDLWAQPDGGGGAAEEVELTPDYTWEGNSWMYPHPTGADAVASALETSGWQFDWVSDRQLGEFSASGSEVSNGHGSYSAVVIPGAELVPLETVEHLYALASAGATIIFVDGLPTDVPGLADLDRRRARLRELLTKFTAAGRVVIATRDGELDQRLAGAGAVREPLADSGLNVLRRRHDAGDYLFLANLTSAAVDGWWPIGNEAASVIALDPLRDERGAAQSQPRSGETLVRVSLAPGESLFLKTFRRQRLSVPAYRMTVATGQQHDVAGSWSVEFLEGGPSIPQSRTLESLISWTELGAEESEFSGTARYTVRFQAPQAADERSWVLDLGDVRETARVRLNGRDLGTAWAIPFRLPVNGAVEPGENVLQIEVTNLAANRVRALARRGELPNPAYMRWRTTPPQEWDPQPSGLLGPVRLVEVED
ncbi:glycosyl hydrolase [Saccharopolyspora sp. 5N708]|uniref:glycosyl hydrolase n=1 Tax=Saccharopolyspora sp. 5N708 TaxID=3457424 RepID=UPI003FD3178B